MIQKHTISVRHALHGIQQAFKTQPNFKIHFFLSLIVIFASIYFKITYIEFLILLVFIIIGLTIETLNTSIEQTNDAIDKNWREDIKFAKDLAAGAMLIFSFGAIVVALIIFIPRILNLVGL